MNFSKFLLVSILLIFSQSIFLQAQEEVKHPEDWSCFLGPRGTGISLEKNLLYTWPENGPPLLWKHPVGTGYSSPSIKDKKLVVHYREGRQEILQCLDSLSGKPLWKQAYPSDFRDPYGYNNGPRCTPLLTADRCFTLGAEGKLTSVNLNNGDIIWQRNLEKELEIPEHFFGYGCTPIIDDGRLYVLAGGQPNAGIICCDAATGKTIWEHVGKETWDGVSTNWPRDPTYEWTGSEMIVSYSSPVIATIQNKKMLLALMRHGLVALDPKTGNEYFKYFFRAKVHESVNASRPVVIGNQILIAAAYDMGAHLLEVSPDGKSVKLVWSNEEFDTHWSTAIEHKGYLYGFCGRHENEAKLRCVDLKTGKTLWSTSGYDGSTAKLNVDEKQQIIDTTTNKMIPFPFFGRGSMTLVDDKFIILGERGTVALAKPNAEKYDEISRFKAEGMDYPSWPAPVISHGILYLRSENNLVAFDMRKK